jgi:hypothetical protein
MRKLILLGLLAWFAKKLMDEARGGGLQTPFPTSSRPPEGYRAE